MGSASSKETPVIRLPTASDLDATDHAILELVQEDSNHTQVDLARRVHLSVSGLKKRLRKLYACGVIKRRVALLDPHALNLNLLCFVQVVLGHHQPEAAHQFCDMVRELPEVLECHALTGEHDYLLRVVARDYQHLLQLLTDQLAASPGVDRLLTSIALDEIKSTTALPLELLPEATHSRDRR